MPVLAVSAVTGRVTAALMAAVLAAVMLALVIARGAAAERDGAVRQSGRCTAAAAALIAVTVAFDGPVAAPLLLAMAAVIAVAGRSARGSAVVGQRHSEQSARALSTSTTRPLAH